MNTPACFDTIRPFEAEEIAGVVDHLFAEPQFGQIVGSLFPGQPLDKLREGLRACPDLLTLQKQFIYPLVKDLLGKCSHGITFDCEALPSRSANYTFVSNHRDIVLDSAFLDVLLVENGFSTTAEIAIGDNLFGLPWIEPLVRLNKSFIVRRGIGMREMLAASKLLSSYMHYAIGEKHENIWIAQREGRAKDSDDRTQESLLKMLAMGGEGSAAERLKALHIVPLAISYEYDPCDYLKAKEFQQKRDNPDFRKSKADDLLNMQTGIFGFKGHIHYAAAPVADEWLDALADRPKAEFFAAVAARMDKEIHRRYRLFENNYVAADLLEGGRRFAHHYTAEGRTRFERYLAERIALVDLPQKDDAFLRERMLTMYANPLYNQLAALA